jgi:hypothetical protein
MLLRLRNIQFAQLVTLSIFLLISTGCIGSGPEIDRYRTPASFVADDAVSKWSLSTWHTAQAGELDATIDALLEPPIEDPAIASAIDRFVILEKAAVARRVLEVERLLLETDPEKFDAITADQRSLLADLRATGLPPKTDQRAADAIESAIDAWIKTAEAAEAASRFDEANDAWSAVGSIAIGSDRPLILVEARRRQRRLSSLQPRGRSSAPKDAFGTERPTIEDALRAFSAILKFHVDSPTWKQLCDAGFDQIAEAIPVLMEASDRAEGEEAVAHARSSFERATAGIEARPGNLPSRVRRAVKSSLEAMGSASVRTPLEPSVVARLFLDGAIAATDLRTNAYFGPQADQVRRQLEATFFGIGTELRQTPEGVSPEARPLAPEFAVATDSSQSTERTSRDDHSTRSWDWCPDQRIPPSASPFREKMWTNRSNSMSPAKRLNVKQYLVGDRKGWRPMVARSGTGSSMPTRGSPSSPSGNSAKTSFIGFDRRSVKHPTPSGPIAASPVSFSISAMIPADFGGSRRICSIFFSPGAPFSPRKAVARRSSRNPPAHSARVLKVSRWSSW